MNSTRAIKVYFLVFLALVLWTSTITVFFKVKKAEEEKYLIGKPFALGNHKLSLLLNKKCLGALEGDLKKDGDSYSFVASGSLNFKFLNKPIASEINLQAVFNELNQLGVSIVNFKSAKLGNYVFGTVGIDPMEFRFKGDNIERVSYQLPGPIELVPSKINGQEFFRLKYKLLSQLPTSLRNNTEIGLEFLVDQEETGNTCLNLKNIKEDDFVDLAPLMIKATNSYMALKEKLKIK